MALYDILSFIIIGYGAGVLSGMFGIGGGIVIVPALTLLAGMNLKEASGTSLAALMLPVGILGCIVYYKEKLLDIKTALLIATGVIITVSIGAYIANRISLFSLSIIYSVFLLYVGTRFISPVIKSRFSDSKQKGADKTSAPIINKTGKITETKNYNLKCLTIGMLAGINAGFFGVGGGAVIVPLICFWLKFSTKRAIATSMGVLLPPIGLPGVLVFLNEGNLRIMPALYVAAGLMLGAILGARITLRLPANIIKFSYGLILIIIGIRFTLKLL